MTPGLPDGFELDKPDDQWLARVRQSLTGPGAQADQEGDSTNLDFGYQTGDRVGAYTLVRPLGSGGMGEVWLAQRADGLFDRDVAIKVIKRGMDTNAVVRRFHNERHVLASLHHPNIARMYDAGAADDGRPYLVMEYIEGLPISDFCDVHKLDIDARLRLFQLSCLAVHHAHRHLILHRDLKPSNLLITQDGVPKLLDFGIARLLDDDGQPTGATTDANLRLLTPRYASPEQITGARLTTATDIYSLGVILFRLLVGVEPYDIGTGSRAEIQQAIAHQTPLRPSAAIRQRTELSKPQMRRIQRRLRGDVDAIVLTALQKNPAQRYASAEQLAEDVHRHLEGSPLLAKRPGVFTRIRRAIRNRRRPLIAAIGGAAIGIGLATAFVVYQFLMPIWMAAHRDNGRMTIIGPRSNNDVYSIIFFNDPTVRTRSNEQQIDKSMLAEALSHYEAAAKFARGDSVVLDEYRIVRLALLPLAEEEDVNLLDEINRRLPLTHEYARSWEAPTVFTAEQLDAAEGHDLRALGLLALLWDNAELTMNAWTRLDNASADPLVEALLGNIYLAMNRPELAYPRLLSAHRELPESANLTIYLADAAARCGDTRQARRLLSIADDQVGMSDTTFPMERVELCCLLNEQKSDEALRLYENTRVSCNPVASMQLVRYFDLRGDLRSAIDVLVRRTSLKDQTTRFACCRIVETWWSQLDQEQKETYTVRVNSADTTSDEWFIRLLRCYRRDRKQLARHPSPHPLQEQSNWTNLKSLASVEEMFTAGEELDSLAKNAVE